MYIKNVFENIVSIGDNDTVIVREVNYFRGIQKLLKSVSKRTISNYIGWRLVQSFSQFLPKDGRQLFQNYKANLTGDSEESKRWEDCISLSVALLDMPLGRLLLDNSAESEFARTKVQNQFICYILI